MNRTRVQLKTLQRKKWQTVEKIKVDGVTLKKMQNLRKKKKLVDFISFLN